MTELTIATNSMANLVGAVLGRTLTHKQGNVEATVSFPGGTELHQVEAEARLEKITDADRSHEKLLKHVQHLRKS
jgi:hypothetical protein